jgi:hypothetical protein
MSPENQKDLTELVTESIGSSPPLPVDARGWADIDERVRACVTATARLIAKLDQLLDAESLDNSAS